MPTEPIMASEENRRCDVHLPVDPFVSNRYHFGMLLGVADLDAEQAYHRGKAWLHNAWLHGPGTVWGLDVVVRADRNEVVVTPGLALDSHGRELRVLDELCVDLGRWFTDRRPEDLEVTTRPDGGLTFVALVELCHDSCLDRPVPSISEPCEDASFDTAYSRAVERGVPRIVAGPPADDPVDYPRLRQLFGQEPPEDELVVAALAALAAADAGDRPALCLEWYRRLAAADTIDLHPAEGARPWSPAAGDGCVPLARLEVQLRPDGDSFRIVADGDQPTTVDTLIRPSHVRTRTIQELTCCCDVDGEPGAGPVTDLGPQVVAEEAAIDGTTITILVTAPVDPRSLDADAFLVATLRAAGWAQLKKRSVEVDADGTTITITLAGSPSARPIRVIVPGAGAHPVLGIDGRPLDGVAGTGPSNPAGRDAALLLTDHEDPQ